MQGYKFRIYPDEITQSILMVWIGHQRLIYNSKVEEQNYWSTFYHKSLSLTGSKDYYPDQAYSQFKDKELTPWLSDVPSEILRNGAYRYMTAYKRYLAGLAGKPVKKSKYGKQSVLLTKELFMFENNKNNKFQYLFVGTDRHFVGKIKFRVNKLKEKTFHVPNSVSISVNSAQEWFLSFNSEEVKNNINTNDDKNINNTTDNNINNELNNEDFIPRTEEELLYEASIWSDADKQKKVIGIDRGVVLPVAASNGDTFALSKVVQDRINKKKLKIKKYQRKLARQRLKQEEKNKSNDNSNHTNNKTITKAQIKNKLIIAKARQYISDATHDFCHQVSHRLVSDKDAQVFVFENLKLKNMMKRPKSKLNEEKFKETGVKEYLPNGARAKAGLNRSLASASLGKIKELTQYKALKLNKIVLTINPAYTSQECSVCHNIEKENRKKQAEFKCVSCGHEENADLNSSKVIKQKGIQFLNEFDSQTYSKKEKKKVSFNKKRKRVDDNMINHSEVSHTICNHLEGQGLPLDETCVSQHSHVVHEHKLLNLETTTTTQV